MVDIPAPGSLREKEGRKVVQDAPGTDRHSRCFWSKSMSIEFRRLINPAVAFQAKGVALYRQYGREGIAAHKVRRVWLKGGRQSYLQRSDREHTKRK